MKTRRDAWYLRLPDGRVITARSTAAVIHHIEAGTIPLNSMCRREPDEEWVQLGWSAEFANVQVGGSRQGASLAEMTLPKKSGSQADINLGSGVSARLDPMRLQTVGVRGLVDELLAALDTTVAAGKLFTAVLTGVGLYLAVFLVTKLVLTLWSSGTGFIELIAPVVAVVVFAAGSTLVARLTHLELTKMRPARWSEGTEGLVEVLTRSVPALLLTAGVGFAALWALERLPNWSLQAFAELSGNATVAEAIATGSIILAQGLSVLVWFVIGLAILLPPIYIVEECSVADGIREWRTLLKEHRSRVFLYEGLALGLGLVASLPVFLPVFLTQSGGIGAGAGNVWAMGIFAAFLKGLAVGPLIAFLSVANVFIYLNLRYEYTHKK